MESIEFTRKCLARGVVFMATSLAFIGVAVVFKLFSPLLVVGVLMQLFASVTGFIEYYRCKKEE